MNSPFDALQDLKDAAWQDRAACAGIDDPELFWPEKGNTTGPAKQVCRICLVRRECLDFAVRHHERHGVWGGVSATELRDVKRRRWA